MNTSRRIFAVASASAFALTLAAAPASARWLTPDPEVMAPVNASLRVDHSAKIVNDGFSAVWPIQFMCPKGETYALDLWIGELNPVEIPDLYGEDQAIWARGLITGTCTGKQQHFKKAIDVPPTHYVEKATGDPKVVLAPVHPTTNTSSQAILSTATGWAGWCSAPNCASPTGPRIVLR